MKAIVYGRVTPFCTYCEQAKELLAKKNIPFDFMIVGEDISVDELKSIFPGASTVPQIMIDDVKVGPFSKLQEMMQ